MGRALELFDVLNNFFGWGDPNGGVWFIGLEEALAWTKESEPAIRELHGKTHVFAKNDDWDANKGSGIRDYTSKIVQPLSVSYSNKTWRDYRDNQMWLDGSRLFQANLWPLGKKNLKTWPAEYSELFGFGPDDREDYYHAVRATRFPRLRDYWMKQKPAATICFGVSGWKEFVRIFELNTANAHWLKGDERLGAFENEKIILTPFMGQGMSNDRAKLITEQLQAWKVEIP
jgi:hypothetical protein